MKRFKNDILPTIIFIALIAIFIFMVFIFPMIYDLAKAGELNLHGIMKYIVAMILAILTAAYIRGISE